MPVKIYGQGKRHKNARTLDKLGHQEQPPTRNVADFLQARTNHELKDRSQMKPENHDQFGS